MDRARAILTSWDSMLAQCVTGTRPTSGSADAGRPDGRQLWMQVTLWMRSTLEAQTSECRQPLIQRACDPSRLPGCGLGPWASAAQHGDPQPPEQRHRQQGQQQHGQCLEGVGVDQGGYRRRFSLAGADEPIVKGKPGGGICAVASALAGPQRGWAWALTAALQIAAGQGAA